MRSILFAALLLAGCNHAAKPVESPGSVVSVPVAVGCLSGARPDAITPLSAQYGHEAWNALTVAQKAALVASQGLKHQNRADALDAATGGCK